MPKVIRCRPGVKFGGLTLIEVHERRRDGRGKRGHTRTFWRCRTESGAECVVDASKLTASHPLRPTWYGMKARCIDSRHRDFRHYGGRGIKVCERWLNSFDAFLEDMGDRPEGHTLDRIDGDGHYAPGNCRWATWKTQTANRPHARGESQGASKLTDASVFALRRVGALNLFYPAQLARWFGVSHSAVSAVLERRTWKHVP